MDQLKDLFLSGGSMMYPLALCAFIALVLIIERLYALREDKIIIPELARFIQNITKEEDLNHAETLSKSYPGAFSNIILIGLQNRFLSNADLNQIIEDQGQYEVRFLEKGLSFLETIANIAPLMGLLGTVFGIIDVFDQIKLVGLKDPAAFSGGISVALITTAFGLLIGIPALFAYNVLSKKAENLVAEIENNAVTLILKIKKIEHEKNKLADL
jgi:biopolymer transport protein ExbB